MLTKKEIGENLKEFAKKKYGAERGSLSKLASALDMRQQSFRTYYEGKSIPGGRILAKLSALGCDIHWLLTGKESSGVKESTPVYGTLPLEEQLKVYNDYIALLKKENERLKEEINKKFPKNTRELK